MDLTRDTGDDVPDCLRRAILWDLLPETLHDLNNACAVLDGIAILLEAEASHERKVLERAQSIQRAGESLATIAWIANGLSAALGSPLSFGDREDGLSALLEVAGSAIERRGGSFVCAPPVSTYPWSDGLDKVWFVSVVAAFAGRGPARVRIAPGSAEGRSIVVEVEGSAFESGLAAALTWLESRWRHRARVVEGGARRLEIEPAP